MIGEKIIKEIIKYIYGGAKHQTVFEDEDEVFTFNPI